MKKDAVQQNLPDDLNQPAPTARGTAALGTCERVPVRYSRVLSLKRSGPEPLYYQLAQSIESAIKAGTIGHGTKLPPLPAMATELNLATNTVRAAWNYLERRGVLTCRHGVGTVVI